MIVCHEAGESCLDLAVRVQLAARPRTCASVVMIAGMAPLGGSVEGT